MDPLHLRTFLAIVETGSFSAAATALHSVQSNVTARVKKLEGEIGGSVFERGRGGARLTPLGERLLPHARDILARIAAAEADLMDAAGEAAPLRLGALDTTAGARLPGLLKALHDRHPASEITLRTGQNGLLLTELWGRTLDAAFVAAPVDTDRFNAVSAFRERLVIVQPKGRETPAHLLAFPSGCIYRAAAEAHFRSLGKGDLAIRDMGSLESILGLVEAGLGFAVAPESAVIGYRAAEALDLRPLPGAGGVSDICLAWRRDTRRTAVLDSLCALLPS